MLKTLPDQHKTWCRNHIKELFHAYNCIKHATTGFIPYFLMFGRSPRLPMDLLMPTVIEIRTSRSDYVKNWKEQTKEAYRLALQHSDDRCKKCTKEQHQKTMSKYFRTG